MVLEQKSLCRFFTLLVFDQMPGTSSLRNTQLLHIIAWLIFAAIGIALSGLQADIIFVTSSASVKYFYIWVKLYRINTLTTLLEGIV